MVHQQLLDPARNAQIAASFFLMTTSNKICLDLTHNIIQLTMIYHHFNLSQTVFYLHFFLQKKKNIRE